MAASCSRKTMGRGPAEAEDFYPKEICDTKKYIEMPVCLSLETRAKVEIVQKPEIGAKDSITGRLTSWAFCVLLASAFVGSVCRRLAELAELKERSREVQR
jgi:hypothetical protein